MIPGYASATQRFSQLRKRIWLAVWAIVCAAIAHVDARESKDWIVLQNCRLISNPANDGDSFHARAGAREYIFRLYMVDAPETDAMNPSRLVEQAKYFSTNVPQAIDAGMVAKEFARAKLSEPFTVFTRMSDAMGHSRLERFYAFVQTKDGDLGEQLVRNGLARAYGFKAVPPGLKNSREELEKLQKFEDAARQEKIGAWGANAGRLNMSAQKPESFTVFSIEQTALAQPLASSFHRTSGPRRTAKRASGEATNPRAKQNIEAGRIDINTATEKELRMIPGVGPIMAARIIAARPFYSADDLKKVTGIGDKKYAAIRPYFQ
jgi:DNA uptake protein ComE-like DNA-binding protein